MFETLSLEFETLVAIDAAGEADPQDVARLELHHDAWVATLRRMAIETDEALQRAFRLAGPEREQVVADLRGERERVAATLRRVGGDTYALEFDDDDDEDDEDEAAPVTNGRSPTAGHRQDRHEGERSRDADEALPAGPPTLQASWAAGRVVLWGGGPGAQPVPLEQLNDLIEDAGARPVRWEPHGGVPLPGGARADALTAPAGQALGWLVG